MHPEPRLGGKGPCREGRASDAIRGRAGVVVSRCVATKIKRGGMQWELRPEEGQVGTQCNKSEQMYCNGNEEGGDAIGIEA